MNKTDFVKMTSKALYENRCDIFVGSGLSIPSGCPSWIELIRPLARDVGIEIDESDNMPLIAQFILNANVGNRASLIRPICDAISDKIKINEYHYILSNTKVSTIWTTNYDDLLEQAFSKYHIKIIQKDTDLSRSFITNSDVEIIKIHGSLSSLAYEDIIITQEDYDDFFQNKPALSQRLCNDMLDHSFLFLGYSYNDINIKNILITAHRISKHTPRQHYMVMKSPNKEKTETDNQFEQKKKRFEMWILEMRRLGIYVLDIEKHEELTSILSDIKDKSKGVTLYFTGSHTPKTDIKNYASNLAKHCAQNEEIVFINGQSEGIGQAAISCIMDECIKMKYDITKRMQSYINPYSANPAYSNNSDLLPELKKYRSKLMLSTQLALFFSGGMGTVAELEVANLNGCKVLPIITSVDDYKNDVIIKIRANVDIIKSIEKTCPEFYLKFINNSLPTVSETYSAICQILGVNE